MTDDTSTEDTQPFTEPQPLGDERKSSLLSRIGVLAFVAFVVLVECGLAYLYLPSASEATASAVAAVDERTARTAKTGKNEENAETKETPEQIEVDLGEFRVTAVQPTSNTILRIEFHMYGTVGGKDEKEFLELLKANQHRFRDQVLVTIRSADINDLTDAGLGLVKRKILDKSNQIVGKPLLRTVIFSDFSFFEQ